VPRVHFSNDERAFDLLRRDEPALHAARRVLARHSRLRPQSLAHALVLALVFRGLMENDTDERGETGADER
jgi:hypothetical protein